MVKLFSHDASDFQTVLDQLRAVSGNVFCVQSFLNNLFARQAMDASAPWPTRYVLLLWMSLIIMLPFDLAVFDSTGRPGGLLAEIIAMAQVFFFVTFI